MHAGSRAWTLLKRLYGLVLTRDAQADAPAGALLDALESRELFSVFTVGSLGDRLEPEYDDQGNLLRANSLTLREAIMLANASPGADAIALSGKFKGKSNTVALDYGPLEITDSLDLACPSGSSLKIASTPGYRTMAILGSEYNCIQVLFEGVTITGRNRVYSYNDGYSTYTTVYGGGGLMAYYAELTLRRCAIVGNTSNDYSDPAIGTYSSTVRLYDTRISGNRVGNEGINYNSTAAFYDSHLYMSRSTISDNDHGLRLSGSTAELRDTTITGSRYGAGIDASDSYLGIYDSKISNNRNINYKSLYAEYSDRYGRGGGIAASDGSVYLTRCSITGNRALEGAGIYASNSTLGLRNTSVKKNSLQITEGGVPSMGGGIAAKSSILQIGESTIDGNRGDGKDLYWVRGGGIMLEDSYADIRSSSISGNSIADDDGQSMGGGLFAENSTLNLIGSRVDKNRAEGSDGGGICLIASTAEIQNSSIQNNVLDNTKYYYNVAQGGGMCMASSSTRITGSTIAGNRVSAFYVRGGGIYNCNSARGDHSFALIIADSTIVSNKIRASSWSYYGYSYHGSAYGGGIYSDGNASNDSIRNSIIRDNVVVSKGPSRAGGMMVSGTVDGCTISDNSVKGGTYAAASAIEGDCTISNSLITGNRAHLTDSNYFYYGEDGLSGSTLGQVDAFNCTIVGNKSTGCPISVADNAILVNCILWGNVCKSDAMMSNLPINSNVEHCLIGISPKESDEIDFISALFGLDDGSNLIGDFDPKFVDAGHGDYCLKFNSPARDAGNDDYACWADDEFGNPIEVDLAGARRVVNIVDIGAYEHQSGPGSVLSGDYNGGTLLTVSAGHSVTFHSFDDQRVRIKLSGPGQGEILLPGDDYCDPVWLNFTGTDASSSIVISTKSTTLGEFTIEGDVKTVKAPGADLLGDLIITGSVRKLTLGDVIGDQQVIAFNSGEGVDLAAAKSVKLSFGEAADLLLDTGGLGISSIKLTHWLDSDAEGDDALLAAWIGKFTCTASSRDDVADLQADIVLSGLGAPKGVALGSLKAGQLEGVDILITDDNEASRVKTIKVHDWIGGSLEAGSLNKMKVAGVLTDLDMALYDADEKRSLSSLSADEIADCRFIMASDAGVLVSGGGLDATRIQAGGDIAHVKAASADGLSLLAGVAMDFSAPHVESNTDLLDSVGRIGRLTLTGKGVGDEPDAGTRSLTICAAELARLHVAALNIENEAAMGLYLPDGADSLGRTRLKGLNAAFSLSWKPGTELPDLLASAIHAI